MLFLSIDLYIPVLGAFCLQKSPLLTGVTGEVCFEGASQRVSSGSAQGTWSLWWPGCRGSLVSLVVLSLEVLLQQNTCHTLSFRDITGHRVGFGGGWQLHCFPGGCGFSRGCTPVVCPCRGGAGSRPCPSRQPAARSAGVSMAAHLRGGLWQIYFALLQFFKNF